MDFEKDHFEDDNELSPLEDEELGGDADEIVETEEEELIIEGEPAGEVGVPPAKPAPKRAAKKPAKKKARKKARKAKPKKAAKKKRAKRKAARKPRKAARKKKRR